MDVLRALGRKLHDRDIEAKLRRFEAHGGKVVLFRPELEEDEEEPGEKEFVRVYRDDDVLPVCHEVHGRCRRRCCGSPHSSSHARARGRIIVLSPFPQGVNRSQVLYRVLVSVKGALGSTSVLPAHGAESG